MLSFSGTAGNGFITARIYNNYCDANITRAWPSIFGSQVNKSVITDLLLLSSSDTTLSLTKVEVK